MGITLSRHKQVSFGDNQNGIITSHNKQSVESLKRLHDRLGEIIRTIGGITPQETPLGNIFKAKEKITKLRRETQEAWGNCPSALKQKLGQLDKLDRELTQIREGLQSVGEAIDNEKPGQIILPGSNNTTDNSGMITDSLDILAAYNSLPKDPNEVKRQLAEKGRVLPKTDTLTIEELKNSLKLLDKEQWDFEKFNAEDCKIYPKLKDQLIIGKIKEILIDQIKVIDKKLSELKESGKLIPEVGVRLYSPTTTGKIMALETAKLRRTTSFQRLITPGLEENLGLPDVMIQPIPTGEPQAYKIDKSFVPNASEMREILSLNKAYKPILEKLYPEGLNVYVVPGYFNKKDGDWEGGQIIMGHKDGGVFLNSYDIKSRYNYTAMKERTFGPANGAMNPKLSVLKGNADRARVLAHEIGHAINFKLQDNKQEKKPSTSSLLLTSTELDFESGWKGLRLTAKLNEHDNHHSLTKGFTNSELGMLRFGIDYEMIAEDIRMAITGDSLPASSKLTGYFDQTPEGKKQLNSVINYIRKCLIEGKSPTEALLDEMNG